MAQEINKRLASLAESLPEEQAAQLLDAILQRGAAAVIDTIQGVGEPVAEPEPAPEELPVEEPLPEEEPAEEPPIDEPVAEDEATSKPFSLGNPQESKYDMFNDAKPVDGGTPDDEEEEE